MNVFFAASEGVPYCKTGGLADVVGALSESLAKENHQVTVVLPLYKSISKEKHNLVKTSIEMSVPLGSTLEPVEVWENAEQINPRVYFISSDIFFRRNGLYGETPYIPYPDNERRFALFSRAFLELVKILGVQPDVIHCHDWQTGLIPMYLHFYYSNHPVFKDVPTVFSIHNMAYQGVFSKECIFNCGLPPAEFNMEGYEFYGDVNFMKAGLVYADYLNTVSPTYAEEVQKDTRFGLRLEGVVRKRKDRFRGILNGLDEKYWDPQTDSYLISPYGFNSLDRRRKCKEDLQKIAGFKVDDEIPLIGFIGRLDYHKGIGLLINILPRLLEENVQVVFLGSGNPEYESQIRQLHIQNVGKFFMETEFAEDLAHKIYGGVDLFLMPSVFEPCGLGQMIAMRYGAIPVVTPTGGLKDTVIPYDKTPAGTGFVSEGRTAAAYLNEVLKSIAFLKEKEKKVQLLKNMMLKDFSWSNSIHKYLGLYEDAIQSKVH